tara:strand:- start:1115 stop:1501 length:387 start_codon:yes stop_codon:yes gene_type:complete
MRGGKPRVHTDSKTRAYEKLVALCASSSPQLRGSPRPLCGDGPVRVDIVAIFPRPQRLQARKHSDNLIPMGCRPDLDNVIKAVLDGVGLVKGLIWNDDGQVSCLRADAFYAERDQGPRLELALFVPTE